jgi:hypothetical protein
MIRERESRSKYNFYPFRTFFNVYLTHTYTNRQCSNWPVEGQKWAEVHCKSIFWTFCCFRQFLSENEHGHGSDSRGWPFGHRNTLRFVFGSDFPDGLPRSLCFHLRHPRRIYVVQGRPISQGQFSIHLIGNCFVSRAKAMTQVRSIRVPRIRPGDQVTEAESRTRRRGARDD